MKYDDWQKSVPVEIAANNELPALLTDVPLPDFTHHGSRINPPPVPHAT